MDLQKLVSALRVDSLLKEVKIDGLDEPVYMREPTIAEMNQMVSSKRSDDPLSFARSAAKVLRNSDGQLICNPDDDEQVAQLALIGAKSLQQINDAYGLITKNIEEEAKN